MSGDAWGTRTQTLDSVGGVSPDGLNRSSVSSARALLPCAHQQAPAHDLNHGHYEPKLPIHRFRETKRPLKHAPGPTTITARQPAGAEYTTLHVR